MKVNICRGQRKTEELFGETVPELGTGTNRDLLGLGMRQEYPGLTDDDVRRQVRTLREKLTDKQIDSLVDSVRLSADDRTYLKHTLRARRDNIVNEILSEK